MIFPSEIKMDRQDREILPMQAMTFPYTCMFAFPGQYGKCEIPWHWHTAFEIDYVQSGTAVFYADHQKIHLHKGEAVFLNTDILHKVRAIDSEEQTKLIAHFWTEDFIAGGVNTVIDEKYVKPVMQTTEMPYLVFSEKNEADRYVLETVCHMTECILQEEEGYELLLRNLLSQIWLHLFSKYNKTKGKAVDRRKKTDQERIKSMLRFIQEHYQERICVDEIARAALISSRECTRCFQRMIGNSPMQYLLQYRLEKAAFFLKESESSILEISENCGFSSNSYFDTCFRRQYGITPWGFRKKQQ